MSTTYIELETQAGAATNWHTALETNWASLDLYLGQTQLSSVDLDADIAGDFVGQRIVEVDGSGHLTKLWYCKVPATVKGTPGDSEWVTEHQQAHLWEKPQYGAVALDAAVSGDYNIDLGLSNFFKLGIVGPTVMKAPANSPGAGNTANYQIEVSMAPAVALTWDPTYWRFSYGVPPVAPESQVSLFHFTKARDSEIYYCTSSLSFQ